jgi:phosphate:Na+ symporter
LLADPRPLTLHPSLLAAGVFGWQEAYLLLGGTALFLIGIHLLSDGLRRALGGRMRWAFTVVARSRLAALASGVAMTGPLQSSGPTTVVLMGLADAGIVTLGQSAAIMLGAMVGGTVVPQLLAFPVAGWGLLAAIAGVPVIILGRWRAWKNAGWALVGLGLMFHGMQLMTLGAEPLKASPAAGELLSRLAGRPLLAAAAGLVVAAALQSSGAAVALVMTLVTAGAIADPGQALPLIIGINLGTCAPAAIAAAGSGREGRRVLAAYVGFKLLGAVLVLPFAGPLGRLAAEATLAAGGTGARAVANLHTAYNLALALAFLLPAGRLAGLLARLVPTREGRAEKLSRHLGEALRGAPSAALLAAGRELADMGRRTVALLRAGLAALESGGSRRIEELKPLDDEIDVIYATMSAHLSREQGLSRAEAARSSRILYLAKLLEEIGDLVSRDLARLAGKRAAKDLEFSMESLSALRRFGAQAAAELERVVRSAGGEAVPELAGLAAARDRIEDEHRGLVAAHFEQLGRGVTEAGETGSIYPDVLAVLRDIRRVAAEMARVLAAGDRGPGIGDREAGPGAGAPAPLERKQP